LAYFAAFCSKTARVSECAVVAGLLGQPQYDISLNDRELTPKKKITFYFKNK
jgi:hypothetical protein